MNKEQHDLAMEHIRNCRNDCSEWEDIHGAMCAMIPLYDSAPELLRALELSLGYLYKLDAQGVQTVVPVSNIIKQIEKLIKDTKGE